MKHLFMKKMVKKAVLFVAAMFAMFNAVAADNLSADGKTLTIDGLVAGQLKARIDALCPDLTAREKVITLTVTGTINNNDIKNGIVVAADAGVAKYLPNAEVIDLSGATMSGLIENPCFHRLPKVKVIKLPTGCEGFGWDSFAQCPLLEDIYLPASFRKFCTPDADPVDQYFYADFAGSNNLKNFYVDPASTHYEAIDGVLYTKANKRLVKYPSGRSDVSFTISAGTLSVGNWAFQGTQNIENVVVPEGVATLGNEVFMNLSTIKSIILPTTLTTLGGKCFNAINEGLNNTFQLVFQGQTPPPNVPGDFGGIFWNTPTSRRFGVPADKVDAYKTWFGGGFSPQVRVYNTITVENGTSLFPVTVGGIDVPITTSMSDFVAWSSSSANVTFADNTASSTTFSVPESMEGQLIVITAKNTLSYAISVVKCTASSGTAEAGAIITVNTDAPSQYMLFDGFTSNVAGVTFTPDAGDPLKATFVMPNQPITVTANFSQVNAGDVIVEVNVTTAGGLHAAITQELTNNHSGKATEDIMMLIVSGPINNDDFNGFSEAYSSLKVLDLNDASYSGDLPRLINCPTITQLILPKTLGGQFNGEAFEKMTALEVIQISDDNPNYKTVDGVLYTKDGKKFVKYPIAKRDLYYTILPGTETLGHSGARFSAYTEAFMVPEGVTLTDEYVFSNCKALKSITFPASLNKVSYGLMRGNAVMAQAILLATTPPVCLHDNGSEQLLWDSWAFSFGVASNAVLNEYKKPDKPNDADGGWYNAFDARPGYIYQPVTVENAMSPYLYAVRDVQVPVIAEAEKGGLYFSKWESDNDVTFSEPENPVTYFTMPVGNTPITVRAIYKPSHDITIVNGTASKSDAPGGQRIEIEAGTQAGLQFSHWEVDGDDIELGNVRNKETYFIMLDRDVTITAVFSDPYTVTVIDGVTLNPTAVEGQTVTIMADNLGTFMSWTSEDGVVFADPNDRNTSFVMPKKNVTVKANFATGIGDVNAESITIYPNPAMDVIYVKGLDRGGYKIVDITGKMVLSSSDYAEEAINVASLPSGVYFFQSNGVIVKFIKN